MNERQLYYFIVTAEERNLGRAAERLPLSLSALSRQMQSLEEELGTVLFLRTASGVELTRAGEALLRHARTLSSQFELIKNDIRQANTTIEKQVNIGVFGSSMLNHIPNIIKLCHKNHPEIEVALHSAQIAQQFENLLKGRILIAFDRYFSAPSELSIELVHEESICLALHMDHPLAGMKAINFRDLRNVPIIGRVNNGFPPECIELFKRYNFEPLVVQKVQDMASAASMVGSGLGVAFVPESLQSVPVHNVVYRPLIADLDLQCNLYCYYRKDDKSPLLQLVLDVVHAFRSMNNSSPG